MSIGWIIGLSVGAGFVIGVLFCYFGFIRGTGPSWIRFARLPDGDWKVLRVLHTVESSGCDGIPIVLLLKSKAGGAEYLINVGPRRCENADLIRVGDIVHKKGQKMTYSNRTLDFSQVDS